MTVTAPPLLLTKTAAAAASNVVQNAGFENALGGQQMGGGSVGQSRGNWLAFAQPNGRLPMVVASPAHSGARIGEVNTPTGFQAGGSFIQDFGSSTVPADTSYTLSAWVYPIAGEEQISLFFGWDRGAVGTTVGATDVFIFPDHIDYDAWGKSARASKAIDYSLKAWHEVQVVADATTLTASFFLDGTGAGTSSRGSAVPPNQPATVLLGQGSGVPTAPDHFYYDDVSLLIGGHAARADEFALPAGSHPNHITVGPDSNLWFTNYGTNEIGRITPSGTISRYPVATGSTPYDITAGPDGNLWFTELLGNQIGKITTSGAITTYPVPTGASHPTDIRTGPDGNLWFTESFGDKIGKITPSGAITEYGAKGSHPEGIAVGPDGNLWFTEEGSHKIAKISSAGVVTHYAASTSGSFPFEIMTGPDHNLWATEEDPNGRVDKITPSGTVTEYVLGRGSNPHGITTGSDGNLWIAENGTGHLARITPAGTITELDVIPTPKSGPEGIATGPDKNLWFAEYNADKIGRYNNIASAAGGPPLVGFGDSVAVGYGLSQAAQWNSAFVNQNGNKRFVHGAGCLNTPDSYPCSLALNIFGSNSSSQDYAIQGAPSSQVFDVQLPKARSELSNAERASVKIVTLTVGANDIQFGDCLSDEFRFLGDRCLTGTINSLQLSASTAQQLKTLAKNLTKIIKQVHQDFPNATIRVTGYYQLFPPPVAPGGTPCPVFDIPALAALERNLGGLDSASWAVTVSTYLHSIDSTAAAFQTRFNLVTTFLQNQLNATIQHAVFTSASTIPVRYVALSSFQGHDMCQGGNSWVFAPRFIADIAGEFNTDTNYGTANCPYPAPSTPPLAKTEVLEPFQFGVGFAIFFSNCMAHPVGPGQQGIAQAVANSLP